MDVKPERGMYKLSVSATMKSPDSKTIENISANIPVKVLCAAEIEFLDVGTADSDQTTMPKLER